MACTVLTSSCEGRKREKRTGTGWALGVMAREESSGGAARPKGQGQDRKRPWHAEQQEVEQEEVTVVAVLHRGRAVAAQDQGDGRDTAGSWRGETGEREARDW